VARGPQAVNVCPVCGTPSEAFSQLTETLYACPCGWHGGTDGMVSEAAFSWYANGILKDRCPVCGTRAKDMEPVNHKLHCRCGEYNDPADLVSEREWRTR